MFQQALTGHAPPNRTSKIRLCDYVSLTTTKLLHCILGTGRIILYPKYWRGSPWPKLEYPGCWHGDKSGPIRGSSGAKFIFPEDLSTNPYCLILTDETISHRKLPLFRGYSYKRMRGAFRLTVSSPYRQLLVKMILLTSYNLPYSGCVTFQGALDSSKS